MGKWIAEFDLEDGDIMPEHMDLEYKNAKIDFHCRPLEQEPTTKNDLAQERYQDLIEYFGEEKVAKTILESRKEFKAWLERLRWHVKRADELARELEQLKGTTKNDLGVDAVSRKAVINQIFYSTDNNGDVVLGSALRERIARLPSVTPQEPRWIPVSERLPEEYGEYLITWTTSQSKRQFIGISEGEVTSEYDHEHNRFKFEWLLEDYVKNYPNVKVTAWMPLPKPFEPHESEK